MTRPDYWMEGDLIVQFRSGVRVLRISTCTSQCGLPGCPATDSCSCFYVYQLRFYADKTREWRRANSAGMPREWAIQEASSRAVSAEEFADLRSDDRSAIDRWNAEGCP